MRFCLLLIAYRSKAEIPIFSGLPTLFHMLLCMIRRTNQRSALDVHKSFCEPCLFVLFENFRMNPFGNFKMIFGWLKILTKGHYVATGLEKIIHHTENFFFRFT